MQRLKSPSRCYAIDTWRGDVHAGLYADHGDEIFDTVAAHNDTLYSGFSTLIRSTFDEALTHFADGTIDLLHIDGRHFYADVKHDYETWEPKLSERSVVLFHDTNVHTNDFGVFAYWAEVSARHPYFEFVHGHGLGVLGHGRNLPAEIQRLFGADTDASASTRAAYGRLGAAIRGDIVLNDKLAAEHDLRHLQSQTATLNQTIADLTSTNTELTGRIGQLLPLETEVSSLRTAVIEAERKNAVHIASRLRLKQQGSQLRRHISEAENDRILLGARVATLESANSDLTARHRHADDASAAALAEAKAERSKRSEAERAAANLLQTSSELARAQQAMLASRSWKTTAPLRALSNVARRMTRRAARLRQSVPTAIAHDQAASPPGPAALYPPLESIGPEEEARLRAQFDVAFYRARYPDVTGDAFLHYMSFGWKEGRDPSSRFSTKFYLSIQKDIAEAGLNPFTHWVLHGQAERRRALPFAATLRPVFPKVTAIVPNYNHAQFLPMRLQSILGQTYENVEIIILDDCSTDNSRQVIDQYVAQHGPRVRAIFNDVNSGSVFSQWQKGLAEASGELVWICESDDFCDLGFLSRLVECFRDWSVMIAFGRILETDAGGAVNFWLDQYREEAEPGIWQNAITRPAAEWFSHGFGVRNVIANVGGCVFRNVALADEVWQEAQSFKVVGDWFLYSQIAAGGQIAWEPAAISYFRRHGQNTSSKAVLEPFFYQELEREMLLLSRKWELPEKTITEFLNRIEHQYRWLELEKKLGALSQFIDGAKIRAQRRSSPHILISFLGFVAGGGELFPIALANELCKAGWRVSMMACERDEVNEAIRLSLDPQVAVYSGDWVEEYGADRFVKDAQVSLIHSHTIGSEFRFFERWGLTADVPYLVTLHGSYEVSELSRERIAKLTKRVSHFIYTAERNIKPFRGLDLPADIFTKLPNAMPVDPVPFPKTRGELGIPEDAVVFTLVARAIRRKGWRAAIAAFDMLRTRCSDRKMHLLLCGEGEEADRHRIRYGDDPDITFLGYQQRIHGLYRMSDVAIVPTRFGGESFPLCIIQALQSGTPVIGTSVGEIPSMLASNGLPLAGLVIEAVRDTDTFIRLLADAMQIMLTTELRQSFAEAASTRAAEYDLAALSAKYANFYNRYAQ